MCLQVRNFRPHSWHHGRERVFCVEIQGQFPVTVHFWAPGEFLLVQGPLVVLLRSIHMAFRWRSQRAGRWFAGMSIRAPYWLEPHSAWHFSKIDGGPEFHSLFSKSQPATPGRPPDVPGISPPAQCVLFSVLIATLSPDKLQKKQRRFFFLSL